MKLEKDLKGYSEERGEFFNDVVIRFNRNDTECCKWASYRKKMYKNDPKIGIVEMKGYNGKVK